VSKSRKDATLPASTQTAGDAADAKGNMYDEAHALALANVGFHELTALRDKMKSADDSSPEALELVSLFDVLLDQMHALLAPEGLPPPDASAVQAVAEWRVADWERRAKVSGNSLYIWKAVQSCFLEGLPLSEYCLSYIRLVTYELSYYIDDAMAQTSAIDPAKAVAAVPRALKITTKQGRPNAFERLRRDRGHEALANREDDARMQGKKPAHRAIDQRNLRRYIKKGRELSGWPKPTP
jgi:hypothetical protein